MKDEMKLSSGAFRRKCTDFANVIVAMCIEAELNPLEALAALTLVLDAIEVALGLERSCWGDVMALVADDGELAAGIMERAHRTETAEFGAAPKPSELN